MLLIKLSPSLQVVATCSKTPTMSHIKYKVLQFDSHFIFFIKYHNIKIRNYILPRIVQSIDLNHLSIPLPGDWFM